MSSASALERSLGGQDISQLRKTVTAGLKENLTPANTSPAEDDDADTSYTKSESNWRIEQLTSCCTDSDFSSPEPAGGVSSTGTNWRKDVKVALKSHTNGAAGKENIPPDRHNKAIKFLVGQSSSFHEETMVENIDQHTVLSSSQDLIHQMLPSQLSSIASSSEFPRLQNSVNIEVTSYQQEFRFVLILKHVCNLVKKTYNFPGLN